MQTLSNNPLRQHFRKPSIYLKLPSQGKGYESDVLVIPENLEIPIFPMTALDEITLKTPDALFNGQAIVDLIKSCAPNIKDPWRLNSVDLDAVLIGIRTASEGNKQEIISVCPSCKEDSKYEINLVSCLNDLNPKAYEEEMILGDLSFKFKPLSYKDLQEFNTRQFEVQKIFNALNQETKEETITELTKRAYLTAEDMTMVAVARGIEYIKTESVFVTEREYIEDYLKNCDKNAYEAIRDKGIELKGKSKIKPLNITCPECSHQYQQEYTLNMSDFFE